MALEIYWTKRAEKKFNTIKKYLAEEWGEKVTKGFVKKVYDFPELGTLENEEKGIRGFPVVKQINLFYRISGDKIILLNFFDNRQNPGEKRRM